MFLFKKTVAPLLFPLNLTLEILLLGLILLWFTRRQRLARTLVTGGWLLLLLSSCAPVSNWMLGSLEWRYRPVTDPAALGARVRWIVVLGGGHANDGRLGPSGQLTTATLARLMEGIRLHRLLPDSRLLLSGGAPFGRIPDANVMAEAAVLFGVNRSDIVLESRSRDTEDEARLIKPMLREQPFLLVTSASHMHRSMRLFLKQGMKPMAAPTDYLVRRNTGRRLSPADFYPRLDHLACSERAVYEYLGLTWAWITGRT
jgi:uncharacterized SAM-binding protein YcdF (DUF218 family)